MKIVLTESSSRMLPVLGIFVFLTGLALTSPIGAQEGVLFINEIIAENSAEEPADIGGGHTDMIEIFNGSDDIIPLGSSSASGSFFLSATATFDAQTAWKFQTGRSNIPARGFLVIFADANGFEGLCELHSSFGIDNNGTEPITLWGPVPPGGTDADRPIIDQVWLPPLRNNVSFGRFPDGAGPSPVPVDETLSVFRFNPPGTSTFGECANSGNMAGCPNNERRSCIGEANGPGGNLDPRIDRVSHSTNHPAAGEAVNFVARVDDDKDPTPGNIASVRIHYSVNGVEQSPISMVYDAASGILTGENLTPPRPLDRWTLWRGTVPGQPAGSRVDLEFFVQDAEGLSSTDPRVICAPGVGPCSDIGLPGPGCVREACMPAPTEGCQFVVCEHRHQYLVGYEPPAALQLVLINEVMATQDTVFRDASDLPCPEENPMCGYEDYIELCNGSGEPVDLAGLWLSDGPFHPQGWQFPPGPDSVIEPGEYLIVWTDNDGSKCPRPPELLGDGQDCPDPNDSDEDLHTNFALDAAGDQIYLFRQEENGFGVVHGVEFGRQELNVALNLVPDCTRGGNYVPVARGTPRMPSPDIEPEPEFRRGDSNSDCAVNIADPTYSLNFLFLGGPRPDCPDAADADNSGEIILTDPVYTLNYLFIGGPRPPDPGPTEPGPDHDPVEPDTLADCTPPSCSG